MPRNDAQSLWSILRGTESSERFLCGAESTITLGDLARASSLSGRAADLRGRSVLIATSDPLPAALALIELDGVARRVVLCPADLAPQHLPFVLEYAHADAIVSDRPGLAHVQPYLICEPKLQAGAEDRTPSCATEWILLTSGTTGRPKMVVHTLASLCGAISTLPQPARVVWSTFYDIRRYGGLQIFLRAILTSASMVLSSASEPVADFLARAAAHGVTHISGTPSHWRRALMCPAANSISPEYVRLSGEIADQGILDKLCAFYPQARVAHAFASTEAGVAFDVGDRLAGFPATLLEHPPDGVDLKLEDGSLRIRSSRTAARYLGQMDGAIADADGFVDTGDMIERRGDRCYFVGRRDGVINVGGQKVHPEEVEAVIHRHPDVKMSLVRARKNPLTGALVVADVVVENETHAAAQLQQEILELCRTALPPYKVPAVVNVVGHLAVGATGKIVRRHA